MHFRVAVAGLTTASKEACVSGVSGAGDGFLGCKSIDRDHDERATAVLTQASSRGPELCGTSVGRA